jgi:hypothetical protein
VAHHERAWRQYQATLWIRCKCLDGAPDAFCVAHRMGQDLDPEGGRRRFNRLEVSGRSRLLGIVKDRGSGDVWRNLVEQFQPFQRDCVFVESKAGGVSARPRQSTKPSPTGSGTWANTTGMVRVSRCNATAAAAGARGSLPVSAPRVLPHRRASAPWTPLPSDSRCEDCGLPPSQAFAVLHGRPPTEAEFRDHVPRSTSTRQLAARALPAAHAPPPATSSPRRREPLGPHASSCAPYVAPAPEAPLAPDDPCGRWSAAPSAWLRPASRSLGPSRNLLKQWAHANPGASLPIQEAVCDGPYDPRDLREPHSPKTPQHPADPLATARVRGRRRELRVRRDRRVLWVNR